jgi:ABC-type branched-subunit amino acid transport system ATPase component
MKRGGLVVKGLNVRFGGLTAVDDLDLNAPFGRITGLIGPNGAGKTTTFNACTGLLHPNRGRIYLHDEDVTRLGPAARGQRGLGRTFQRMELFDSLSVRDNVALGCEAGMGGSSPWRQLWARQTERRRIDSSAQVAMRICNIEELAYEQVGLLSTAQRRLVELARCLAGPFDVLLLDEPSSGLEPAERARFGSILQTLCAKRGIAILIVEHDMSLVLDICQYLYVLDFGRLIFEGPPDQVRASPVVQTAYLGVGAIDEPMADEVGEIRGSKSV